MSTRTHNAKKTAYFTKLAYLVENYTQILLVEADNVGSRQMAQIRFALRGKATLLMGKNTMIRTALRSHLEKIPALENLLPLIKANIGMVFCHDDAAEIRKIILEHRVPAPAKQGAVAPVSVSIPPGPTGMDPGQTAFFQALQIATKIVKGQIEIQNEVQVIKEGDKVTASQAVLLTKLNIRPFSYGLKTTTIYDNGSKYPASVLDIDPSSLVTRVRDAVQYVAAFSLAASVPTKASVPHSILTAARFCYAVGLGAGYMFPGLEQALACSKKVTSAPATAPAPAAAATAQAAAKPVEEEEEEDEDMGFSLFD